MLNAARRLHRGLALSADCARFMQLGIMAEPDGIRREPVNRGRANEDLEE
jgi:hypothetical protein